MYTSLIGNRNVLSKTGLKESYFVQSTPEAMRSPQFVALSKDRMTIYTLKYEVKLGITFQNDFPELQMEVITKTICKYNAFSGERHVFQLDTDFDFLTLCRTIEMYILGNDLLVVVGYEPDQFLFTQRVVRLLKNGSYAEILATRCLTVTRLVGPSFINLSTLSENRIIISGSRTSENGRGELMALSISADPLKVEIFPDVDYSGTLGDFNRYLASLPPDQTNGKMLGIFLIGIFEDVATVLLSNSNEDDPTYVTEVIGKINLKTGENSIEKIDNSVIRWTKLLRIDTLKKLSLKNQFACLSFSVIDIEKSSRIYWRLRRIYVYYLLKIMVFTMKICSILEVIDGGFTLYLWVKFVEWWNGPSMIPIYKPENKMLIYLLDWKKRKFHEIRHNVRVLDEKMNLIDHNVTEFASNYDIDSNGGTMVLDSPTSSFPNMSLTYYPNPTKPRTLSRSSMYSAYRNYPCFEKSSLLRKLTGNIDWNWSV